MAKRTTASIGFGIAAIIAAGWLGCASSEAPEDRTSAAAPAQIPEALRASDPSPAAAITLASLSGGGVLEPGIAVGNGVVAAAEPNAELPSEVLAYLTGDLTDDGSLQLDAGAQAPRGIPISMTSDTSLLGEEFDFPTPSLAPPASPALD